MEYVFLDSINMDLDNIIWDASSVVWFVTMAIFVALMFVPQIYAWKYLKICGYYGTLLFNILAAIAFTWYIAIPLMIGMDIGGVFVGNRYDAKKLHDQALLGGHSTVQKWRLKQIEEFPSLPFEKREAYLKKVPPLEKMKVRLVPFFAIVLPPSIALSVLLKFLYKY